MHLQWGQLQTSQATKEGLQASAKGPTGTTSFAYTPPSLVK